MGRVRRRPPRDTPVVAFCIHGQSPACEAYRSICRDLGIHWVPGVAEAISEAKERGQVVTGVVDGREVDRHLNETGHAIVGKILWTYLRDAGLLDGRARLGE